MRRFNPYLVFDKRKHMYPVICPDEEDGSPSRHWSVCVEWHAKPTPRPVPVDYRPYREHALAIGSARQRVMERRGRDRRHWGLTGRSGLTATQNNQMACCGEVAVALFLGLDPLEQVRCFADVDDGTDLVLSAGQTVQVKTRPRRGLDFLKEEPALGADYGFLVWCLRPGRALVVGYLTRDDYARWTAFNDQLPYPAYLVPWKSLRDGRGFPLSFKTIQEAHESNR